MALQPALQVATRVLNSNHPFLAAVFDYRNRRRIPHNMNPLGRHGASIRNFHSISLPFDEDHAPPYALLVYPEEFDIAAAAASWLEAKLTIDLGTSSTWKKGKREGGGLVYGTSVEWGADPRSCGIDIELAVEIMWPLLVPGFTAKEKAACTLMVATTLLHEIAVSPVPGHPPTCS